VSYLSQWLDPSMEVGDETRSQLERAEVVRLRRMYMVAAAIVEIPRRLGEDASAHELSVDKKRGRRICHVAVQLISSWTGKETARIRITEDLSQEAAVLDWERWWQEHDVWLTNRQRYIATWAHYKGGQERWCKSAMVKFGNERLWIEYALRD